MSFDYQVGYHCAKEARLFGNTGVMASCKKPPGHEGPHKDRLWTIPPSYFYVEWFDGADAWSIQVEDPTPTRQSGVAYS